MFWLLQNNHVDRMTGPIATVLRQRDSPFMDFSLGDELPEFTFDPEEDYFFYGSTGLHGLACVNPIWGHHVLDDQKMFDQRIWLEQRGSKMLNQQFDVMTFRDFCMDETSVPRFVRPIVDQKAFTGQVIVGNNFHSLYEGKKGRMKEQKDDMLVAVSGVQDIQAEFRFIVRNNQPIVGSYYRKDNEHFRSLDIPSEVLRATVHLAKGWMPSDISIMDVAVLKDGQFRIVEFNGIHGSGLYAMPPCTFIDTVETHIRERK